MKCKNCSYEGKARERSFNLCPNCLFNSLIDDGEEDG